MAKKCHLDAGRAQKLITGERNVWLSSPVTRWSWWADKGSAKWFLPFLWLSWLDKIWDTTSAAASPQPLILAEQDLEDNGDKVLVPPTIQVVFHQDGGHFLTKNKRSNEALNPPPSPALFYIISTSRDLITYQLPVRDKRDVTCDDSSWRWRTQAELRAHLRDFQHINWKSLSNNTISYVAHCSISA